MSERDKRLSDISFSGEMLLSVETDSLGDAEFRALMRLVKFTAAGQVWTYTPPSDGSFPDDDTSLARLAGVSLRKWKALRPALARFFYIKGGRWRLNRDWIEIGPTNSRRPAISAGLRSAVLNRDGYRCGYCGNADGPFHLDHIVPHSVGGELCEENLITACPRCNLAKGARTPEQWLSQHNKQEVN